jgi:hypothetical protein
MSLERRARAVSLRRPNREGPSAAPTIPRTWLDAPWGIARAPGSFGRFSGDLLVGNFGDGTINAYEQRSNRTFTHVGELRAANGKPLAIDDLWALQFGHGTANNGPANTLFFTAGPDDEAHGLFGTITVGCLPRPAGRSAPPRSGPHQRREGIDPCGRRTASESNAIQMRRFA